MLRELPKFIRHAASSNAGGNDIISVSLAGRLAPGQADQAPQIYRDPCKCEDSDPDPTF